VATPSQGTCGIAGSTVTCDLGALAAHARATITISGTLAGGTAGQFLDNTATVSATQPDPDQSNNSDSIHALIRPTRLALTKTASRSPVDAGDDVTFTIVLRNSGPASAVNVVLCDTLPSHMTFSSAPGATFVGGRACWSYASLGAGARRTVHVVADVDADAPSGVERNVARATSPNAGTAQDDAAVRILAQQGGGTIPVTG
jgi:uncharacterized repeat protein (TIGR01451 family)